MAVSVTQGTRSHLRRTERNELPAAKRREKGAATGDAIDLGPLDDSVGYLLRRAQMAVFQRFFDLFAAFDIRPAQYSALTVIDRNPGLSQTRLADTLGIKKANLVAIIDTLEARGLARRRSAESDRRSHALYLTPRGTALVARLHRLDAALDRSMSRTTSEEERRHLCDALRRIGSQ
ncbi:MAG: MarR family transcriptional regulator [Enhydrobacter sp.]|nr:MAG: MarR family transcriptional regulator [Enhydrobacter sp.]